jgi:hypothetical protein
MARWSVHIIGGKRTEFLGFVTALDERKALDEAIKVFQVPKDWQTHRCSAEHWVAPKAVG